MSVPDSLAPAARLSIDSARSPACAANASDEPEHEAREPRPAERGDEDRPDDRGRDGAADDALERSSTARCGA